MRKLLTAVALCPLLVFGQANPISNLKLQGNANANTNSITNAVDFVTFDGISLRSVSTNSGGGGGISGAITQGMSGAWVRDLSIGNTLTVTGQTTFADNAVIASGKHLELSDGGGTNRVYLHGVLGRLVVSNPVDIVTGRTNPATINGAAIATVTDVAAVGLTASNALPKSGGTMTSNAAITFASGAAWTTSTNAGYIALTGTGIDMPLNGAIGGTEWELHGLLRVNFFGSTNSFVSIGPDAGLYRETGSGDYLIWDQGNDGAGSGLDADLLRGVSGTNYVRGVVVNGTTNRPDSNGLAQLGTISGGGSAALSPWTNNVNAAGFSLTNLPSFNLTVTNGQVIQSVGTNVYRTIYVNGSGVPTNEALRINGVDYQLAVP